MGMEAPCTLDCFLLSRDIGIFGRPEKAGLVAKSWDSWLLYLLSRLQAQWDHTALGNTGLVESVCEVGPLGVAI